MEYYTIKEKSRERRPTERVGNSICTNEIVINQTGSSCKCVAWVNPKIKGVNQKPVVRESSYCN